MNHFCTISTYSHLYKVKALAESLHSPGHEFLLHVLVVDDSGEFNFPNCKSWKLSDFTGNERVNTFISKYQNQKDKLRWCLKPVFLQHLLEQQGIEKVIYLDNDLFFYSDYQFLFELLSKHSFLLTPHHYNNNPKANQNWLEANFRVGLFNAGFVGVNRSASKTLQWWADCCNYRCEKNSFRGLFDDQKYLDLIPVIDENAHIVRHKGCNVAGWNTELCKRETVDGQIKIDGQFPIVFIHFNNTTIREMVSGNDKILSSFYRTYFEALKKHKQDLTEDNLLIPYPLMDKIKYSIWKVMTNMGI